MQVIHDTAGIYVPTQGSIYDGLITPGSGIVGTDRDGGLLLYYEGNHYNAINMHEPRERVICAFGRLATGYPTSAMMWAMPENKAQFIRVGEITWPNIILMDSEKSTRMFDAYMARYTRAAA